MAVAQQIEYTNPLHPLYDYYVGTDKVDAPTANDTVLTKIGHWAWGPCRAVAAEGNYAYIGNGPTFQVLDFSSPSSPEIIAEYYLGGAIADITLRDALAFVVNGGYLFILDISNPMMPSKLGELYLPYRYPPGELHLDEFSAATYFLNFIFQLAGSRSPIC